MTSEHVPMAAVPGQPSGDIRRGATLALLLLLALNLALRSYVSLRPLEAIDGLTIPDDAYLSLSIARNIAQGLGPQYGEQYTNGFQPFYVFLMVPVYWLIPHDPIMPVHLALLLTSLFDTLTLLILLRLVRRVSTSACTPILTALLWMLHPRIIGVATNGLETAIACFFVVWVLAYFHKHFLPAEHAPNRRDCVRLGVLLGLGMLARIDCIVLAAVVTALLLWMHGSARRGALAWAMVVNASMFLVYLPWLAYSYAYTGERLGRALDDSCQGRRLDDLRGPPRADGTSGIARNRGAQPGLDRLLGGLAAAGSGLPASQVQAGQGAGGPPRRELGLRDRADLRLRLLRVWSALL